MSSVTCVTGESICGSVGNTKLGYGEDHVFLRGYNTYEGNHPNTAAAAQEGAGEIVASINGMVEVTDRVVSVKGMSSRYTAEIGDIVVGRVKEVAGNRWRIDIGAFQDAVMLLSNVTEPGGILRRRGRDDELTMRNIFDEGELVVAEVQRISTDGVVSLHTRSGEKYGKLSSLGILVSVSPALVRRVKHHFICVESLRINLVVGTNGAIWVSSDKSEKSHDAGNSTFNGSGLDIRRNVARVVNCIRVMGIGRLPVFDKSIDAAVKASIDFGLGPFDVLNPANRDVVTTAVLNALITLDEQAMYSVTVNALHRNSARSGKCTTSHCLRSLLLFVVLCTILVVLCFTEVLVDKSTQSVAKEVYINPKYISVNTLIIVPGHGVLKTARGYEWRNNSRWCLESHQLRNDVVLPFCFASHIKRAVEILKTDIVSSVVIFSGGQTCSAAGPRSEALSYYTIAEETGLFGLFETNVDVENILRERLFTEEFAEDSYENLLFSVARFCEITGRFPTSIVVVGWKHKEERFTKYHRKAIRFPRSRFTYVGLDFKDAAPFATSDLPYMMAQPYSDTIALSFVTKDMYLCSAGKQTRRKRNPYSRVAPYTLSCPPLRALLQHCGPHLISSELTPWN